MRATKGLLRVEVRCTYNAARHQIVAGIIIELEHENYNQMVVAFFVASHGVDESELRSDRKQTEKWY
jgi:hypothetical protein